jgi:hypothetical protein
MTPVIAILFMCGVMLAIVGAARGIASARRMPHTALWLAVSLYGLVLASAGVLLAN